MYYAEAVDKEQVLAKFMAGEQQTIATTSALGIGVDVPDI